jgi:hypothetical protein
LIASFGIVKRLFPRVLGFGKKDADTSIQRSHPRTAGVLLQLRYLPIFQVGYIPASAAITALGTDLDLVVSW